MRGSAFGPLHTFNEWEPKGAPLRLEVGPRDVIPSWAMAAELPVTGRLGFVVLTGEGDQSFDQDIE